MTRNFDAKKVERKQRRCEAIIQRDYNLERSIESTNILAILNAGLATGLSEEQVFNEAAPHGHITQIVMLPGKSYCFLECKSTNDANQIYEAVNDKSHIGMNGSVVYLSFFRMLPSPVINMWQQPWPSGLYVLPNFVNVEEENEILKAVDSHEIESVGSRLKHRKVKHFGYEFLYGVNNVNPENPLENKIPSYLSKLWPRLQKRITELQLNIELWGEPDQLTVNEYESGQGIPPHVDTHSAFLDPILSLSLRDSTVMDFRRANTRVPIILPRFSLLIMSGESRYDWTHGITPRFIDVVPSTSGSLTSRIRQKRVSLTFRHLRRAPCNCLFPKLCDSQLKQPNDMQNALEQLANQLEENNVHQVYENIAGHFSETRHKPWPRVVDFLDSFEAGALILDIGCGNGKYLNAVKDTQMICIGCDRSQKLVDICNQNGHLVFRSDCLAIPMAAGSVQGCLSIAVIHHLATPERRRAAIHEMARILTKGGRGLIYVWAKQQEKDASKSSYLRQNKALNKMRSTEEQQRQDQLKLLEEIKPDAPVDLPVHTNRTNFQQQDVLVPWKCKVNRTKTDQQTHIEKANSEKKPTTFYRFYHVFEANELENLIAQVAGIELVESFYDQGNFCAIFQRK